MSTVMQKRNEMDRTRETNDANTTGERERSQFKRSSNNDNIQYSSSSMGRRAAGFVVLVMHGGAGRGNQLTVSRTNRVATAGRTSVRFVGRRWPFAVGRVADERTLDTGAAARTVRTTNGGRDPVGVPAFRLPELRSGLQLTTRVEIETAQQRRFPRTNTFFVSLRHSPFRPS